MIFLPKLIIKINLVNFSKYHVWCATKKARQLLLNFFSIIYYTFITFENLIFYKNTILFFQIHQILDFAWVF